MARSRAVRAASVTSLALGAQSAKRTPASVDLGPEGHGVSAPHHARSLFGSVLEEHQRAAFEGERCHPAPASAPRRALGRRLGAYRTPPSSARWEVRRASANSIGSGACVDEHAGSGRRPARRCRSACRARGGRRRSSPRSSSRALPARASRRPSDPIAGDALAGQEARRRNASWRRRKRGRGRARNPEARGSRARPASQSSQLISLSWQ